MPDKTGTTDNSSSGKRKEIHFLLRPKKRFTIQKEVSQCQKQKQFTSGLFLKTGGG